MREIKFRGKRIDNGEWVYGQLIYFPTIDGEMMPMIFSSWHDEESTIIENAVEVIPDTVGQFTGLKDKNGVDIYDGDVTNLGNIFYYEGSFLVGEEISTSELLMTKYPLLEVIGNIHENN